MTSISRRALLQAGAVATAAAAMPGGLIRSARAQSPARPYRITVLTPRLDIGDVTGFREYFDSQAIPVEFDVREVPKAEMVTAMIPEIKAARPDLVMTVFTPTTMAAVGRYDAPDRSAFITDIPVVFSSVTDPVSSGIVPSLDRPGGNVTGTRHIAPADVQLKTIQAYRPIKRLAVVYNPGELNMVAAVADLRTAVAGLGMSLIEKPLSAAVEGGPDPAAAIPDLIAAAAAEGAEMIYIGPDTLVASRNNKAVAEAALAHRLPTFCATELPIRSSDLLLGLVSRAINVGRFAGYKATEILRGERAPGAVPIETLNRFSLLIRIEVARRLGLYPPMRLLNIAEIIQS